MDRLHGPNERMAPVASFAQLGEQMIPLRGCIEFMLKDIEGRPLWPEKLLVKNAVMTGGRAWLGARLMSGNAATAQSLTHIALGTATTAPATSQSALGGETTRKSVGTWDTAGLTATAGPYFAAYVDFATNEGNGTLAEIAFFNSSAVGTMLTRTTYATFVKDTSNTLGVTYSITH